MANERTLPRGVLSAGITVKIDWSRPGDQWRATARPNVSMPLATGYVTEASADDPAQAAGMAVADLVNRAAISRAAAGLDRVPVNEDTVDRLASAVADRVAERLGTLTAREAVPAAVEPKPRPKNGRRRRKGGSPHQGHRIDKVLRRRK